MGKLHRDIKPSNVLVTQDGRVVILDFGLVTDLAPSTAHGAVWVAGGTPAYMPPEAGPTITPTEAADWYAVGVTLFEALTGGLPFGGASVFVATGTRASPPDAGAHVTPELNSICRGLLHRDPTLRLTGEEVLRQLGPDPATAPPVERHPARDSPFVGRARELTTLAEALDDTHTWCDSRRLCVRAVRDRQECSAASISRAGDGGRGRPRVLGTLLRTRVRAV